MCVVSLRVLLAFFRGQETLLAKGGYFPEDEFCHSWLNEALFPAFSPKKVTGRDGKMSTAFYAQWSITLLPAFSKAAHQAYPWCTSIGSSSAAYLTWNTEKYLPYVCLLWRGKVRKRGWQNLLDGEKWQKLASMEEGKKFLLGSRASIYEGKETSMSTVEMSTKEQKN